MRFVAALLAVALGACASTAPSEDGPRVLVYTNANGWVHASIPVGVEALREIGAERGFAVDATDDSLAFTDERLAGYDAVVFLNTTGDVLGRGGEAALWAFVEGGGGFVGVHAAADTEYDWPWYRTLVGAHFESHPPTQPGTVVVDDPDHPATRGLPARWDRTDEWYAFDAPPTGVRVLLRLDTSTVEGETMGDDHPIAWAHTVGRGRSIYTAMGHTGESYAEPLFRGHLGGAVCWAAQGACAE